MVFLVRSETLPESAGLWFLIGCSALVVIGGVAGWVRRVSTATIATRIDRASGLSDRLATACAFEDELRGGNTLDEETRAFMQAAIDDAVRAAPRANVVAATPYRWPQDTRAAVAFAVAAAVVCGLYLAPIERDPAVSVVTPPAAPRGGTIDLRGVRFADDGQVLAGQAPDAPAFEIVEWTPKHIRARVPAAVAVGKTSIVVQVGERRSRPVAFEVLPDGVEWHEKDEPLALAEEDLSYTRDLLDELRQTAEANQDQELRDLTNEIEKLLDQAEKGELSREELLEKLAAAHEKYNEGASEKMMQESLADLEKTGKELEKSELTKDVGKALSEGDLEKAQKEMEKLAEKLAKGEVGEKQAQEAAKALEKAAKAFEKKQGDREKSADEKVAKAEKELAKAEKQAAEAKTPEQKAKAEKNKAEKQQKAEQAQKESQQQKEAEEKRTLKRLHRNMEKAAQEMGDKSQEKRKQASRSMEDMARDTGKVDKDQRKMANQKKVASQLNDLKEAMRRAKQGGSRGAKDLFGRNKKQNDFSRRARGQKGSRQAWKPGQKGQGKNGQGNQPGQQPGGPGNQPGGTQWGDGEGPELLGDATKKKGNTEDESVSGIHGKGPSTRETILSAAQKGFATQSYKQVYGKYKAIVEEVMNAEKVPSGYKYYVKKYFQKIKPHEM
ncbi:MAG TPA: hypothetical protein VMZ28_07615 [Kofleriaceae bacterium]|nr:hypothetical protein [Kofleriaceae bacterium]